MLDSVFNRSKRWSAGVKALGKRFFSMSTPASLKVTSWNTYFPPNPKTVRLACVSDFVFLESKVFSLERFTEKTLRKDNFGRFLGQKRLKNDEKWLRN